jgi:hypothetical protein
LTAMASLFDTIGQYRSSCPPDGVMSNDRINGEDVTACAPKLKK